VKRFTNVLLLDVSRDGKYLCTYANEMLRETYTVHDGIITRKGNGGQATRGVVSIVRTRDWKTVFTYAPPQKVLNGSFFADSEAVVFETLEFGPNQVSRRVVVRNEWTKVLEYDHLTPVNSPVIAGALWEDSLLATHVRWSGLLAAPPQAPEYQVLVLPDYHVAKSARIVLSTPSAEIRNGDGLSKDRKRLVQGTTAQTIVCWDTESLKALWEVPIPPGMTANSVGISGDGGVVAAGVSQGMYFGRTDRYFVGIYRGSDGKELAKYPVRGYEAIALSGDGKLFAASRRLAANGSKDLLVEVEIYETETGHSVGRLTHMRVPPGQFQFMLTNPGRVVFSNEKTLVVSGGEQVSVWEF